MMSTIAGKIGVLKGAWQAIITLDIGRN